MPDQIGLLATNIALLRSRANRFAYVGMAIAVAAVLVATAITAYMAEGNIGFAALLAAQASSPALWLLDILPFAYAFWGQYSAVLLAREAGSLIERETEDLRARQELLEAKNIQHSAMDDLTGLAGRALFLDVTQDALETRGRSADRVGVLVVDLRDFKGINAALGLSNGDRVLRAVARRLREAAGDSARVARLGGDRFALLQAGLTSRDGLVLLAKRVERAMEAPVIVGNQTLSLSLTAGAAMTPDDGRDAEALLNCAELAMDDAKQQGTPLSFYAAMRARKAVSGGVSDELRAAIEQNQLTLYAQPIVEAESRQIRSVETLLRWEHPQRGMIMPGEFIARAERSGLIMDLTRWVLRRSLQLAKELQRVGQSLDVSINISARSMLDPHLPDMLRDLIAEIQIHPERLILEIVEDTAMSDRVSTQHVITQLAGLGVQISIDDFGTGYSQLASLQRLPVNEIKIDRSFVADLFASEADVTLMEATINMGRALGLRIVGEGVEDEQHAQRLTELGCHCLQGFHVARPMPSSELLSWMERWKLYGGASDAADEELRAV